MTSGQVSPKLAVADYWAAFSEFGRADEDQDLGAAGVAVEGQAKRNVLDLRFGEAVGGEDRERPSRE